MNQEQSENLFSLSYTLLPALNEGFFTDITFTASNGEKVFSSIKNLMSFLANVIYIMAQGRCRTNRNTMHPLHKNTFLLSIGVLQAVMFIIKSVL